MREFKLYSNIDKLFITCKDDLANQIPVEFHNFYESLLTNVPNRQIKTKITRKLSIIVASVIILLITYSGITIAQNSEAIKNLYKKFYAPTEYKEYSKEINTTVKLGDVDVTINDLVFDNNFLLINYTASTTSDKKIGEYSIHVTPYPELPDNPLCVIFDNSLPEPLYLIDQSVSNIILYQFIFKNGIETLPDKLKMKLEISAGQDDVIRPTQLLTKSLYLDLDNSKLSDKFKVVNINKEFALPKGKLLYDKMVFSPFGAVLQVKSPDFNFIKREYNFGLYDEKGNEIKPEYISRFRTDDNKLYYSTHSMLSLKDTKLNYSTINLKPQTYEGLDELVIKAFDARTGKVIDGSTVTVNVPKLSQ